MSVLSELDLALVNAVQVEPRAPWPVIGSSLGISAATAARRWEALKAARTAWTGSTMGPLLQMGAVVELRCRTGTVEAVAAALTSMPSVLTVGRTLGSFDLYALTVSPTPSALSAVAAGPISALDVLEARVHPYYRIFGGARWTLGILNRSQVAEIVEPRERVLTSSPASDLEKRLFLALGGDGRRSSADLAAELDVPAWTVRRQLALMRRRGLLEVRTDMARGLGGWPFAGLLWLRVPDEDTEGTGRELGTWPEIRFAAPVVSASNLFVVVNIRSPGELQTIASRMRARHRTLRIDDRRLVTRLIKVHGHLLDEEGRSLSMVTVDPWAGESSPSTV